MVLHCDSPITQRFFVSYNCAGLEKSCLHYHPDKISRKWYIESLSLQPELFSEAT